VCNLLFAQKKAIPLLQLFMHALMQTKMKSKKNMGGNTATGLLTLFTGLRGNKVRVYEYNADFPFEIKDSTAYHCMIHYAERQSAEREREKEKNSGSVSYTLHSGEYSLMERGVDSSFINVISCGNDTLVTFGITYVQDENEYKSYTHFWDGSDSATIIALPQEWNNVASNDEVKIFGKIEGSPFTMKTGNESTAKEFYIDEKLVMIMYGKNTPEKALLFQPVSTEQLKISTILSLVIALRLF
jgi:hypothetical protein